MEKRADKIEEFHSWECISLIGENGSTLDFVIKDEGHMMAVLNVLGKYIYQSADSKFLKVYQ